MRTLVREEFAWRGYLAADELDYEPAGLVDARRGAPPAADPGSAWPVLVAPFDVFALALGRSVPVNHALAVALLHALIVARAGGVHAQLPGEMPDVRERYGRVLRSHESHVPAYDEALDTLIGIGALARQGRELSLPRAPAPSPAQLRSGVLAYDGISPEDPGGTQLQRLLTDARIRLFDHGFGARGWRGLAASDRLRAEFADPAPGAPDPIFRAPPAALAARVGRSTVSDCLRPRGGVPASALPAESRRGQPLLLGEAEIAALLFCGDKYSRPQMRRVVRSTQIWLVLAEQAGGQTGSVDVSVAALTRDVSPRLQLDPEADNRKTIQAGLAALEKIGAVSRAPRTCSSVSRLALHRPQGPDDTCAQRFQDALTRWRLDSTGNDRRLAEDLSQTGQPHLERNVRDRWFARLASREISVRVTGA